jgi:hypothetical protein
MLLWPDYMKKSGRRVRVKNNGIVRARLVLILPKYARSTGNLWVFFSTNKLKSYLSIFTS